MTVLTKLLLLPKHDPSGGSDMCTIKVACREGQSLLQASFLTVYNTDGTPLVGSDFELTDVEIGVISGDLYGVNFWPYLGSGLSEVLITLTPYYSDSLPGKPGEDISVRLPIGET
jgi:hypothetical protein